MAGHSHWKQIKEQKGSADRKRAVLFSKLLRAISAAVQGEPNPDFNPRLRTAVQTARAASVPHENIERAVARAGTEGKDLEEIVCEAYGPGGVAIMARGVTSSRNRTIAEIKLLLREHGGKWADSGSVRWAFEETAGGPVAKFPQAVPEAERGKLAGLVAALENHADIVAVATNAA